MKALQIVLNETTGDIQEEHILSIPVCCPVSKNPRPGSQLIIRYYPCGKSLEIKSLIGYIHSFVGGLRDDHGEILVRDIETMIQRIQKDCSDILDVKTEVHANLELVPKQQMILRSGRHENRK